MIPLLKAQHITGAALSLCGLTSEHALNRGATRVVGY